MLAQETNALGADMYVGGSRMSEALTVGRAKVTGFVEGGRVCRGRAP